MSEYWVAREGERYGPYTQDQLVEYYKSGQIQPTDQVCRPGTQEWVVASSMSELSDSTSPSPPPAAGTSKPSGPAVVSSDLVGPILVTLFCCLPFGIISIVYASQVPAKVSANDIEGAQLSANLSKTWMTWGLIAGVVSYVLFLAFWFFVGFAGAVSNSN